MNRLGLKISCFIASILIWVQVAATTDVEQAARLPLRVTGLAEGLTVVGNDIPSDVVVRLRGSKLRLLANRFFRHDVGEVRLNLGDRVAGDEVRTHRLGRADVVTELEVVRFQSDTRIRVLVDRESSRRLPVVVMLVGELPEKAGFLTAPHAAPDSVLLSGPSRFVAATSSIVTESLNLARLQAGQVGEQEIDLRMPNRFVHAEPTRVTVRYATAALEDRTLPNVPVIPLVDSDRLDVGVSPPVADVMVRGVADSVRVLTEARLAVTVPVGDRPEGVYVLPGQVDYPPWLTLLELVPAEFRVIVGNPPIGAPAQRDTSAGTEQAGGGNG